MNAAGFLVCSMLMFAGLSASAQENMAQPEGAMGKTDKVEKKKGMINMRDGVMMKDGKMMMMKDGKMMAMKEDMTMSNGTKVMANGEMMMKDGTKGMMKEGMMMDMNGKMSTMKKKGAMMGKKMDNMKKDAMKSDQMMEKK